MTTRPSVAGRVYQTAQVAPVVSSVNFGTRHVGDVVPTQTMAINNTASGALVDVITGGFGAVTGGAFSGTGNLGAGVGSGQTSNALQVGLSTLAAGIFSGQANLSLASHNPDMADLSLSAGPVALSGTVNNYAVAALGKTSGTGNLSGGGTSYSLSLGNVTLAGGSLLSSLFLTNAAPVGLPADFLNGTFDVSGAGVFGLTGFNAFTGLAAGALLSGLNITLDPSSLGFFTGLISLHWNGTNPDYTGPFTDLLLSISANVVDGGNIGVPEPPAWAFLLLGAFGLMLLVRRGRGQDVGRPLVLAA